MGKLLVNAFSLEGRTALVTGAGSGTGAAVLVTDLDPAAAEVVAKQIVAAGGTAESHELDVRDRAMADAAAAHAARIGGGTLNILVDNAGAIGQASYITGQVLSVDGGTVI